MKAKTKITRSEKKLFLLTGILLTLLISFGAWWQWANEIPDVKIPTPKMPSPNAYDFYVKAIAAYVPANPPVDPILALQKIPKEQWGKYYSTAKKEAWLRQNAPSLKLLRQGFKYTCRVPIRRSYKTTSIKRYPYTALLARMLVVESNAYGERGNWKQATDSALDVLELGQNISQGGGVLDYLISASINAIGRRRLWEVLPRLNATETKAATRRLEKIIQNHVTFSEVLREEKYSVQAQLLEWMETPNWRAISRKNSGPLESIGGLWVSVTSTRRSVFSNYTEMMDALISAAEKPYITNAKLPEPPDDIFSDILTPIYSRTRWNYARGESGNALFLVSLALRAYEFDHKSYPQNLRQLVPKYLQKIPADPFGGGEELRYRRSGREYSLYSIGPDGIDNNGRAIENTKVSKEKRGRFYVQPDSKGDMVAGVN